MSKRSRIAAVSAVGLTVVLALVVIWNRHTSTGGGAATATLAAIAPSEETIEEAIRASKLTIGNLSVRSSSGIVILRGSGDADTAQRAVDVVKALGVERVANLIRSESIDDEAIRRDAERRLSSLSGAVLRVDCQSGVLSVSGKVTHESQKDAARMLLRTVRGAREIRVNLTL
jgi:osmotically-inducible protein OsmY